MEGFGGVWGVLMEFWKGFEGFWRGFWCCLGGFSIVILRVWCSVRGPWDDIFVKF